MTTSAAAAVVAADWRARLDATAASLRVNGRGATRAVAADGRAIEVLDLGVSGTIEGWVLRGGLLDQLAADEYGWFVDVDVALDQQRFLHFAHTHPGEPFSEPHAGDAIVGRAAFGQSRFEEADGAGMRLLLPTDATGWDGRLWVLTSGTGIYRDLACVYVSDDPRPRPGELIPRPDGAEYVEGLGANLYAETLVDRGSAVAWIRKDEVRPPEGVNTARLAGGTTVRVSHHSHVGYTLALIELAQRELHRRLGTAPARTYLYGHSSGAATARLLNLRPACNQRADGSRIVDGMLCDDAAAGMHFPVAFDTEGQDTVLTSPEDRTHFVPQLDVTRALYQPSAYLPVKRRNAELLRAKGLADRHRHYEVADVSHFDAGMADRAGNPSALDLGGLFAALFATLDEWVDGGVAPPRSRERGDAIALPETSCPLGVREAPAGGPKTRFIPFDGADGRETVTQAWRRLGLLDEGERFELERYRAQLGAAAAELVHERLLSPAAAAWTTSAAEHLLARSGARP